MSGGGLHCLRVSYLSFSETPVHNVANFSAVSATAETVKPIKP